jgi:hypothetical protein
MEEYTQGAIPRRFVTNEPGRQWSCPCGADIQVRMDRLALAYQTVADTRQGKDRVIAVPLTDPPG